MTASASRRHARRLKWHHWLAMLAGLLGSVVLIAALRHGFSARDEPLGPLAGALLGAALYEGLRGTPVGEPAPEP